MGDRLEVLSTPASAPALTLGARDVLVGRAHLYRLAAADEADVRHCIESVLRERVLHLRLDQRPPVIRPT